MYSIRLSARPVVRGVFLVSALAFSSLAQAGQGPLQIRRITPAGKDVPPGREIVIQFDRPVVPLGRMERAASELPIKVMPPLACQWRWLDQSALACQLGEKQALQAATRYQLEIQPGIKALDGQTMAAARVQEILTQRPDITDSMFRSWLAPGVPQIAVVFNQPVSRDSVRRHVFIVPTQGQGRVTVKVERDKYERKNPRYVWMPDRKAFVDFGEQPALKPDEQPKEYKGDIARRVWLITPEHELALDTQYEVKVEPGLASALGPEAGVGERTIVQFATFPPFRFLGVVCQSDTGDKLEIAPGHPDAGKCDPRQAVSLRFSSSVIKEAVKSGFTIKPDLAGGRQDYDPWENIYSYSQLEEPHLKGQTYELRLPEALKAAAAYVISGNVKDEFGRALPASVDFHFFTDHRRPDFKITHRQAVLEKDVDSEMPLYVTNIKQATVSYRALNANATWMGKRTLTPGSAQDLAFAIPMQVRAMLKGGTGVVYGTVTSQPAVTKDANESTFLAQVTPFQVFAKIGHYDSLVWVTDMRTGEIVPDADVRIEVGSYAKLGAKTKALAHGHTDKEGLARLKGSKDLDPSLKFAWKGYHDVEPRLLLRVTKGHDFALLPLDMNFVIDTYRVASSIYPDRKTRFGHIHAWGLAAQGVYRAGDTIQYKFYVRDQSGRTFVPAPSGTYTLTINDPTGKTAFTVHGIHLSKFGAYAGEFKTATNAPVGWYDFALTADFTKESWSPLRVLVSDFTTAPFKVESRLSGDLFQSADTVQVWTTAKLHSGGPYPDAQARVTATVVPTPVTSDSPVASGFQFDSDANDTTQKVFEEEGKLDAKGELVTKIPLAKVQVAHGRLMIESAVRDERGKYISAYASSEFRGVDRFVGLRNTKWVYTAGEPAAAEYLVIDAKGQPVSGQDVNILIERYETKAARVKGAGDAYLTNYVSDWVVAGACDGRSKAAAARCEFTPASPGSYRLTATVTDTLGHKHQTMLYAWVQGKGPVVWDAGDQNALQIVPEKTTYKIGEKAKYLVKNPYPGARALITIERYGVIKSWEQVLTGSTPIIEFPVEPDYLPGFYLSVVVVSPRVTAQSGFGKLDLGKPTFRMGYVAVPVEDAYKRLDVQIKTDKDVYRPRDKVQATLVATPHAGTVHGPIELAVVVVDEAVFDLIHGGKTYYDPYKGFYTVDGLDLTNYALLTRLVGRQKFEKKGANAGGDGGGGGMNMRSNFKYVAYWNPSVQTDKQGRAAINFDLPDNLTGWKILAMAVTPGDRMGLGDHSFKVNRPTELRPVMPNQVAEGDQFEARFSVMNRTDQARTLDVEVSVAGDVAKGKAPLKVHQTLALAPFKTGIVAIPVTAAALDGADRPVGALVLTAHAGDRIDRDGLIAKVPVLKRRALLTAAEYGTTTAAKAAVAVSIPKDIYEDTGSVGVVASPTVIGNAQGAFRYMRDYPYSCWEQKLSRGVMASHYMKLKGYLPRDFVWEGAKTLPQDMLDQAASFQAPNGGMTFFVPTDGHVSPYLSAYTALAFAWLHDRGYHVPEAVADKLDGYLQALLKRNTLPSFYTEGMSSSVRAVALAALARQGKLTAGDVSRYTTHVDQMDLFGKAEFLDAALRFDQTKPAARAVAQKLLDTANQSAGKLVFSEVLDDGYSRILATPLRANCAILSALTAYAGTPAGKAKVGDLPFKILRAVTQTRGDRDHFENTQENVFCMNALVEYATAYESTKPAMQVAASFAGKSLGTAKFADFRDPPVSLTRPLARGDAGKQGEVQITRSGQGRLYYTARVQYSPLAAATQAINAGIEIHREYSVERDGKWVLLAKDAPIARGELVRITLFLSVPAARNYVVVDDPVPGGIEPVNRDLATASTVDADKGAYKAAGGSWFFKFSDWIYYDVSQWSFYHQELRHDSARFYADYLPAGHYLLSYTAQAIAAGTFTRMPAHAEEMYDPDVYGASVASILQVHGESGKP